MSALNDLDDLIKQAKANMLAARDFPYNTTPASRALEHVAAQLGADRSPAAEAGINRIEDPKALSLAIYTVLADYYNLGALKKYIAEI